jgi:hypothetical protein
MGSPNKCGGKDEGQQRTNQHASAETCDDGNEIVLLLYCISSYLSKEQPSILAWNCFFHAIEVHPL